MKKKPRASKTIYFKLEGNNRIRPQAFSGREIATIILNLEDSLRIVAKNRNPELDADQLFISLVDVVHASNGLKFTPSIRFISTAFIIVANAVQTNNYENIPPKAVTGLKEIQKVISHKEGCVGTFVSGRTRISQITKLTAIEIPTVGNITGETILYGEIQRLGGADPKVVLKLHNGDSLYLDVSVDVARSFGNRLYTEVGLKGTATWSYSDNKLLSFRVESITDYSDTPIDVAFEELRGSIGKYWDEIEDIKEALLIG